MSCFLFTGMREQEVSHLYWRDVNWEERDISVTAKPELEWTTKTYEERTVDAPEQLMDLLRDAYQHREGNGLILAADMPKFTKCKVTPYAEEQLDGLLAVANPWESPQRFCWR